MVLLMTQNLNNSYYAKKGLTNREEKSTVPPIFTPFQVHQFLSSNSIDLSRFSFREAVQALKNTCTAFCIYMGSLNPNRAPLRDKFIKHFRHLN